MPSVERKFAIGIRKIYAGKMCAVFLTTCFQQRPPVPVSGSIPYDGTSHGTTTHSPGWQIEKCFYFFGIFREFFHVETTWA